jgi:hypothetical protein
MKPLTAKNAFTHNQLQMAGLSYGPSSPHDDEHIFVEYPRASIYISPPTPEGSVYVDVLEDGSRETYRAGTFRSDDHNGIRMAIIRVAQELIDEADQDYVDDGPDDEWDEGWSDLDKTWSPRRLGEGGRQDDEWEWGPGPESDLWSRRDPSKFTPEEEEQWGPGPDSDFWKREDDETEDDDDEFAEVDGDDDPFLRPDADDEDFY